MMKRFCIAIAALLCLGAMSLAALQPAAQQSSEKYVPGMLIIKLKPELRGTFPALTKSAPRTALGIPGLDGLSAKHGVARIEPAFYDPKIAANKLAVKYGLDLMYVLYFDAKADVRAVQHDYQANPAVAAASPNGIREYCYTPNDPMLASQWHLGKIQSQQAWDVTKGDSTVVLAIVDSGCDWTHPDLAGNSWVNAAEDINHNGKFDNWASTYDSLGVYGDLDGIDNDSNGLADDVLGWDFTDGDSNPYPDADTADHGTHCNGCAAATTNNGIGVAGPGFNCKRISFRCSSGDAIGILLAMNAMYYAVQQRATVISLSWGGYTWFSVEQDIINYAWDNGTVIVASAGNDNVADPHYPSALAHVIAVAATDPSDLKSGFFNANSNYGAWVDIASPGEDILSTTPNNTYQTWDGTSMAAPIVAGVVGLIRSAHPGWTNQQIVSQLLYTADNIDALNPSYAGKLGSGRVNAYRAVTTVPAPRLIYADHSYVETAGNGNGKIESGETIALTVMVQNLWGDALGVNGVLSTTDPFISVTAGTSTFGTIENRINGGQTRGNNTAYALQIAANAPNHVARLSLQMTATGYDTTISLNINLGRAGLLLVNDGEGFPGWPYDPTDQPESFGDRLLEKFYTSSLDSQGYRHDIWRITKQQAPSLAKLKQYGNVMWVTEWTSPSLDSANIDTLTAYLNQGGGLFISGQDLGWEADYYKEYIYPFYTNFVHAQFGGDAAESFAMTGIPGDPIGDSINCSFWQPYFSASFQYADYFTPINGATAAMTYDGPNGQIGLSKYAGTYRLVYMPIGLESVNNDQGGSVTYDSTRSKLAGRIVRWLQGNIRIGHTRVQDVENVDQDITVTASITSDNLLNTSRMKVYWKRKSLGTFDTSALALVSGDTYSATIPAFHAADSVFYFLYAEDASGYSAMLPAAGADRMSSFYVGPDLVPPAFSHQALPDTMDMTGPYPLSVRVTDNLGVDTSLVKLHFYRQGAAEDSCTLVKTADDTYSGQMTFTGYGKLNQRIYYYVTAHDISLAHNRGTSSLYYFNQKDSLYYENFTILDTVVRWSPGLWIDTTLFAPPSPPNAMKSQRANKYSPGLQSILAMKDGFNLEPFTSVQLRFKSRLYLDTDADIRDTCYVQASNDTGATWVTLASYSGNATTWQTASVTLDSVNSLCWRPQARHVQVRFFLKADAEPDTNFGWIIDDIKLKADGPYFGVAGNPPAAAVPVRLGLSPACPNPMSYKTTIRLHLPAKQQAAVCVYNVLGQHVRTLVNKVLPPGSHDLTWNGADEQGKQVSNGVYLYRLKTGNAVLTQKLVILR